MRIKSFFYSCESIRELPLSKILSKKQILTIVNLKTFSIYNCLHSTLNLKKMKFSSFWFFTKVEKLVPGMKTYKNHKKFRHLV